MLGNPVTVNHHILEGEMYTEEELLLHYKIEYPQFSHSCHKKELDQLNCYYRERARKQQAEFEEQLYAEALQQYRDSIERDFPFHPYEAYVTYMITYNQDCVISLYSDAYTFTGGAHGNTIRQSETWNITQGMQMDLSCMIKDYNYAIVMICKQIATQISHGEDWYFDDYPKLVMETFNPKHFYLTEDGVTIYFQQYDIAPYSSGIVEFVLPWGNRVHQPNCCKTCK